MTIGLRAIEAHRDELNARYARSELPPPAMLDYLRRTVVPILDAWGSEPASATVFALFDLGLAGARAGLVGELGPTTFESGLVTAMPQLRAHVERAPGVIVRALGNGYRQIHRMLGVAAADSWLADLATGAPRCADRTALLELGVVLGWRAGLAEARETALACASRMDAALHQTLFGVAQLDPDPVRRFCRPGSTAPLGAVQLLVIAGGFVGFGGPFRRPPIPRVVADRLVCTDGEVTFELFADAFGARMTTAAWAHAEATTGVAPHAPTIRAFGVTVSGGELDGAVAVAEIAGLAAVTRSDSHQVFVLGRREAT